MSVVFEDFNIDIQLRVKKRSLKRKTFTGRENPDRQMDIFKRKKNSLLPSGSAKERHPDVQKHYPTERKVLSDNSNIVRGHEYIKKQAAECPKIKQTFRATPGTHANRKLRKNRSLPKRGVCINGPDRIVPFDEPMDLDDPVLKLRSIFKTTPLGVDDIDLDKSEFYSPCYAQDVVDYLQAVEARWTFPANYLADEVEVTPGMRAVLVDWMLQVQCHERQLDETLHMAVAIVDRYMSLKIPSLTQLQLLGITAILLAAKYQERFPPEMATLCHLTDNTYSEEDIEIMEIDILHKLKFDLSMPSPNFFLDRFLQAESHNEKMPHFCRYLLDLSIVNVNTVQFVPSLLAASAIYIARRTFLPLMGAVWTPNLYFYTKYNQNDLQPCVHHLERLLRKVPKSKYQAAQNKYSKPKFECISQNPLVCSV